MIRVKTLLTSCVAVAGLMGTTAVAQVISQTNGSTVGQPTFNRPNSTFGVLSGNFNNFQTVNFNVAADGPVRVETLLAGTNFDTFVFVYDGFNPANPLSNGVAANDDGGAPGCGAWSCSLINTNLTQGNYTAVVTSFFEGETGLFLLEIESPGLAFSEQDSAIAAAEVSHLVTDAQAQGLRQIVRANSGARDAADGGSMIMSSNGNSTSDFSVWAEIGGHQVNADFGQDLDLSSFHGQAGVEAGFGGGFSAGISVGGALTSAQIGAADLDGDALFVQPYVAYTDGPLTAVASFIYTYTDYDDSTDTIDRGDRFAGSLSVGYGVPVDEMTTATPFGFLAGGIESFDTSSGSDDVDFVIARAGVELSHAIELLNTGNLNVFASAAGEYVNVGEPDLAAPVLLAGHDDSRFGARVEAGFDFTIAGTDTQMFVAANGSGLLTDAPGFGGRAGIKFPF